MNKMAIGSICLVFVVLSILLSGDVLAQSPCDNVTQHLENMGAITSGNYVQMSREISQDFGGVPVIRIRLKNETMDKNYFVNCISGEVYTYDELPGYMLSDPILSKIDQAIRFQAKIRPNESKFQIVVGHFTPTEEKKEILESLGMEMDELANEVSYKQSQEYGTPYTTLKGYATYDSILKIAELDFVTRITLDMIASASVSTPGPRITLVANSIDYSIIDTPFLSELQIIVGGGKHLTHITAPDFEQHQGDLILVILGGPDAPEGVGEVVRQILTKEEQDSVRVQGSRRMFIKRNLWAPKYQVVFIIAGSDRTQTKLASSENKETIHEKIREIELY